MKHLIRRATQLIAIAFMLPLWPAGDADAVFEASLRGDYDLSAQRVCEVSTSSPGGPIQEIAVRGISTFDGAGGVTFTGQFLLPTVTSPGTGVSDGAGGEVGRISGDFTSCSGSYTVNADGTFTQTLNCNFAFTGGPNAGNTGTINNIAIKGKLTQDGTILTLGTVTMATTDIETLSCPTCSGGSGLTIRRGCSSVGLASSRR